jgi:hypothetical protein
VSLLLAIIYGQCRYHDKFIAGIMEPMKISDTALSSVSRTLAIILIAGGNGTADTPKVANIFANFVNI